MYLIKSNLNPLATNSHLLTFWSSSVWQIIIRLKKRHMWRLFTCCKPEERKTDQIINFFLVLFLRHTYRLVLCTHLNICFRISQRRQRRRRRWRLREIKYSKRYAGSVLRSRVGNSFLLAVQTNDVIMNLRVKLRRLFRQSAVAELPAIKIR